MTAIGRDCGMRRPLKIGLGRRRMESPIPCYCDDAGVLNDSTRLLSLSVDQPLLDDGKNSPRDHFFRPGNLDGVVRRVHGLGPIEDH